MRCSSYPDQLYSTVVQSCRTPRSIAMCKDASMLLEFLRCSLDAVWKCVSHGCKSLETCMTGASVLTGNGKGPLALPYR